MKSAIQTTVLTVICLTMASNANADGLGGIKNLHGLDSISIFERTGITVEHVLNADGPELTGQLLSLNASSNDFIGTSAEFYDAFYSDGDGTFNINGDYLTILVDYPAFGGGNISSVVLNFAGDHAQNIYANTVASYSMPAGGDAYVPQLTKAVDGSDDTWTYFSTSTEFDRARITVGLEIGGPDNGPGPTDIPEPATLSLLAIGLAAMTRRRRA